MTIQEKKKRNWRDKQMNVLTSKRGSASSLPESGWGIVENTLLCVLRTRERGDERRPQAMQW